MALLGRNLRYTKWLNLRQLLELSGPEMGCGSEDFGLKMTHFCHSRINFAVLHNPVIRGCGTV
jgi:hypothetical protein